MLELLVQGTRDLATSVRHDVRAHLRGLGMRQTGDVEVAVAEAVGNAVLHGYRDDVPGLIEVVVIATEEVVEVVVHDDGVGPIPHPEHSGAGYGIVLMRSLADRFELRGGPGAGTTVTMHFARSSS